MSTISASRQRSLSKDRGDKSSSIERRTRLLAGGAIAAFLIGYLPQFVAHGRRLWAQEQYQYAPFVVLVVVALLATRWKTAKATVASRRTAGWRTESILWLVSVVLLAIAVFFFNPSLAVTSAIIATAGGFLCVSRCRRVTNLWGIWCLLWLLVPIPFGFDGNITRWLQLISSGIGSQLLDFVGVNHLMEGNVLRLPSRTLFVDEACSGIVSMMAVVAAGAMFAVWKNRSLIQTILLLAAGVGWAVVMNIVRIFAIAVTAERFNADISEGLPHQVLGLVTFGLVFVAVVSTDRLIAFLLDPIELGNLWQDELRANPLIPAWNRFVACANPGVHSAQATVDGETTTDFAAGLKWALPVGITCAALGAYQVVAAARPTNVVYRSVDLGRTIGQQLLPAHYGSWVQTSFQEFHRRPGSQYGEFSRTYAYQLEKTRTPITVSLDFPFSNAWHELCICYQNNGWQLAKRRVRAASQEDGQAWNYVEAEFEKVSGERGYLAYAYFDGTSEAISPPTGVLGERLIQRLRRRAPHLETPRYFQTQAWTESMAPLDEKTRDEIQDAFLEFRERFRQHFVTHSAES